LREDTFPTGEWGRAGVVCLSVRFSDSPSDQGETCTGTTLCGVLGGLRARSLRFPVPLEPTGDTQGVNTKYMAQIPGQREGGAREGSV